MADDGLAMAMERQLHLDSDYDNTADGTHDDEYEERSEIDTLDKSNITTMPDDGLAMAMERQMHLNSDDDNASDRKHYDDFEERSEVDTVDESHMHTHFEFVDSPMAEMRLGPNMTLKEQSRSIERLMNENFDLKLKVMFLTERLEKVSEEGVKEVVSENVKLKTILGNLQRDKKALRKKVRDFESRPTTAATTSSGTSSNDAAQQSFVRERREREEEVKSLHERIKQHEVELEKMRADSLAQETEKQKLAEIVKTMSGKRLEATDAREKMDGWKDLAEQETARRKQSEEENRQLRDEILKLKCEPALAQSGRRSSDSAARIPATNHTTNIYNITKNRQVSPSRPMTGMSEHPNVRGGILRRSASDSILDRLAPRTYQPLGLKGSAMTRVTPTPDITIRQLKEENAQLRDNLDALRLGEEELQQELQRVAEDLETTFQSKQGAEDLVSELSGELHAIRNDLVTAQAERDEALRTLEYCERDYQNLKDKADEVIEVLVAEAGQHEKQIDNLRRKLADKTKEFNTLSNGMREVSEAMCRLEYEDEAKNKRIEGLEGELENRNREVHILKKAIGEVREEVEHKNREIRKLKEAIGDAREEVEGGNRESHKLQKAIGEAREQIRLLEAQKESSHGEIVSLKEEQDDDKVKIGDLEGNVNQMRAEGERGKERLLELENNLHQALLELKVTRSSFIQGAKDLQRQLNDTTSELLSTRDAILEKERLIKQRDSLLEHHGLESRKLADMLEKERQAHRSTRQRHESSLQQGPGSEEAWGWRLKEMERRLNEEREGRRLDRKSAQRRVEEERKARRDVEEERRREKRGETEKERASKAGAQS